MNPAELVTLVSLGTGGAGVLVGWGIAWGMTKKAQSNLMQSHNELKDYFIRHKDNHKIHIDPDRDEKAMAKLELSIDAHFKDVKETLTSLNRRCEDRLLVCASHFSKLDKKMAVALNDPNGDT